MTMTARRNRYIKPRVRSAWGGGYPTMVMRGGSSPGSKPLPFVYYTTYTYNRNITALY